MELKEKFTQLNAALFALQVEISAIPDGALNAKLNVVLFALQMRIAKLYEEIKTDYAQKESSPLADEHNEIYSPGIAFDCNPPLPAPATIAAESLPATAQSGSGLLLFTEKEIMKMPKSIRKSFRAQGCTVHYRERTTGRYTKSYEARYAKKPYNKRPISVSATTIIELKARFIEKLNSYVPPEEGVPTVPTTFDGFAMYWFENFHKRKVAEKTYDHDIKLYNRHIKERFGKLKVKDVNAVMLQDFLDNAPGTGKTAKDLHSILKQTLDCAVKHGLIQLNPLGMCILDDYEQEHGVALSYEEEHNLNNAYQGTEWEIPLAVVRYTGMRPCEYTSAVIEGDFIKAQNGKRKDGKIEFKYIPITPMLRPFLQNVTELCMPKPRVLNRRFQKVLPNHKLYDMRTTFQTRCSECGIPDNVIGVWMGNSIGKLKEAYTDFSKEYLLQEAEKFVY